MGNGSTRLDLLLLEFQHILCSIFVFVAFVMSLDWIRSKNVDFRRKPATSRMTCMCVLSSFSFRRTHYVTHFSLRRVQIDAHTKKIETLCLWHAEFVFVLWAQFLMSVRSEKWESVIVFIFIWFFWLVTSREVRARTLLTKVLLKSQIIGTLIPIAFV